MAISISAMTAEQFGTRTRFNFSGLSAAGERITVDLSPITPDAHDRNSLPSLWYQHGFTKTLLPSYWVVDVYATEENGNCWGRYNPQVIPGQNKINFKWMLPATAENRDALLAEIVRRANGGC